MPARAQPLEGGDGRVPFADGCLSEEFEAVFYEGFVGVRVSGVEKRGWRRRVRLGEREGRE